MIMEYIVYSMFKNLTEPSWNHRPVIIEHILQTTSSLSS
jgi:hypothetical protein